MRCFFHADDCGLTRGITESILTCLDAGPLSGASVMMGGEYAREALAALAQRPQAMAAAHLNLLEGAPVAPPADIPELVGQDGLFRFGLLRLSIMLCTLGPRRKKRLLNDIRTEFSAQIDLFRSLLPGAPLRIDGHLHIHALPLLHGVLRELIHEYPVSYVRVPGELRHKAPAPLPLRVGGSLRRGLLSFWAGSLRTLLQQEGVAHSRFFIGAFASGHLTLPRLQASLDAVRRVAGPEDSVEIMVHPGGLAPGEKAPQLKNAYRGFYTSPAREVEKALLLSPEFGQIMGDSLTSPHNAVRGAA